MVIIMNDDILEDYRNNILKKFEELIKEIEYNYYKTNDTELKNLLAKIENDFYSYCEKYYNLANKKIPSQN